MSTLDTDRDVVTDLREHLVNERLAGDVATQPGSTYGNAHRMVAGDVDYTFGLPDWREVDHDDVLEAVAAVCGPPAVERDPEEPGWIDPDLALAAIERHREALAEVAATGGRVLFATGHPTGLLAHYQALARALAVTGIELLTPLDDSRDLIEQNRRGLGIRYLDGVACAWSGGELMHTHRSTLMEAMLDALDGGGWEPDLVVGDHGMAGAAIARGHRTLSIADVNDPALMVAQVRGRTDAVLPLDDNLAPRLYRPVTAAMLADVPATPGS